MNFDLISLLDTKRASCPVRLSDLSPESPLHQLWSASPHKTCIAMSLSYKSPHLSLNVDLQETPPASDNTLPLTFTHPFTTRVQPASMAAQFLCPPALLQEVQEIRAQVKVHAETIRAQITDVFGNSGNQQQKEFARLLALLNLHEKVDQRANDPLASSLSQLSSFLNIPVEMAHATNLLRYLVQLWSSATAQDYQVLRITSRSIHLCDCRTGSCLTFQKLDSSLQEPTFGSSVTVVAPWRGFFKGPADQAHFQQSRFQTSTPRFWAALAATPLPLSQWETLLLQDAEALRLHHIADLQC